MASVPFFSGKDAIIRLFINGDEVVIPVKNWEVGVVGVDAADGVNGEQRDRLQFIVNYFEGSFTCWESDVSPLEALINNINNDDQEVLPLEKTVGFNMRLLDGTRKNFAGKEGTLGAWRFTQGGRTERVTLTVPFRIRFFDEVASA